MTLLKSLKKVKDKINFNLLIVEKGEKNDLLDYINKNDLKKRSINKLYK